MFGNPKGVLQMAAGASASAGGAVGYAGFWLRVVAILVDSAILTVFGVVLIVVLGMALGAAGIMIGNVIYFLAYLLYWPVMESSAHRATFGKRVVGIEVTDLDGNRTSFIKALLRNLCKLLSSLPMCLGFLLAAFTDRKQALHDMITKCLVVRAGPSSLLKAMVAAAAGLILAVGASYYYVVHVVLPQQIQQALGPGGDFQREMEKAMKDAGKDMPAGMEMKSASRESMRDAQKSLSDVSKQPSASAPASVSASVSVAADSAPRVGQPPQIVASAPAAVPVPAAATEAPSKSTSTGTSKSASKSSASAPAKEAAAPPPPAPAKAAEAPPPAPAAAPSGADKPKAKRRAAKRKPDAAPQAAPVAETPARSPKYNDVMTAVMYRDPQAAQEILELGGWVDRPSAEGLTPLMAAALNGDAGMTALLLKHGANPQGSLAGGSVLPYAAKGGNAQVMELLKKAGAR